MTIEWNKVTWYSKTLAALIFVATFLISFWLGSLYQQAKDYSSLYSTNLQPPSATNTTTSTNTRQATGSCVGDSDCLTGYSCMTTGPIIAGQAPKRICTPNGQAVPL